MLCAGELCDELLFGRKHLRSVKAAVADDELRIWLRGPLRPVSAVLTRIRVPFLVWFRRGCHYRLWVVMDRVGVIELRVRPHRERQGIGPV